RSVTMNRVALASICLACAACVKVPTHKADAMSAVPVEPLGEDRLSLKWKFVTADRLTEVSPQEFAAPAVWADTVYIGSASGTFYALRASNNKVRWRKHVGSVGSAPLVSAGMLYIGTSEGILVALDAQTGVEKWHYQSRGPIEQTPVASGDLIIVSNEADQVAAVDAVTGKFKWQYKSE